MNGEMRALDPAYVQAQRLAGWLVFAAIIAVWAAAFTLTLRTDEAGLAWLVWVIGPAGALLAPLLIWTATGWPALSYRHWAYRLDEQGIEIHSGVVIRRVTIVPRSRVQHTDVSQGPIERRYGLGTLVIYTAGTHYARVELPGLAHGVAVGIRDALLPKTRDDAV